MVVAREGDHGNLSRARRDWGEEGNSTEARTPPIIDEAREEVGVCLCEMEAAAIGGGPTRISARFDVLVMILGSNKLLLRSDMHRSRRTNEASPKKGVPRRRPTTLRDRALNRVAWRWRDSAKEKFAARSSLYSQDHAFAAQNLISLH